MAKHNRYSHYRPAIISGIISGVIVSVLLFTVLWFMNNRKNNSIIDIPIEEVTAIEQTTIEPEPVEFLNQELLFGGTTVLPGYTYIALYGNPEFKGLGALGEQPLIDTFARVKQLANEYQLLTENKVIPTLELITTIASAGPTDNQDYSQEIDIQKILAWVEAANNNDIYVVIDLQPGRNTFKQQAIAYEEVLKKPNVGLALDPEWRLRTATDRHMKKVGSVDAAEVNEVSDWLADLVKANNLPQKIFMIHQFKLSMIENRIAMKTDRDELGYIIHMDGHGELGQKIDTWNNVLIDLPANTYLGWKNFYDEDKPTPTPAQTMQQLPQPVFVSYQ